MDLVRRPLRGAFLACDGARGDLVCQDYEFRQENIHDTALSGDRYDLIVSNGVFEHVTDLKGVLRRLPLAAEAQGPGSHLR